ncbi:unnamed protein product [Brassica rapa]|uniref:Uncharacterized protein n=1 Tax=Brassica campestris TaxID=3711 RepID=A0A8D9HVT2_BRACM|nr:unnamed protein product [Brassica rapa]
MKKKVSVSIPSYSNRFVCLGNKKPEPKNRTKIPEIRIGPKPSNIQMVIYFY